MNRSERRKAVLKKTFRLLLLAACLAYIVYFFVKNRDSLHITFAMDWRILGGILALQIVYFILQSWRFQIVMEKCSASRLPFWGWLRIFILGRFLNLLFSQLGNVYRGVRLKKDYGVSYTHYISGYASMAWLDALMNFVIALAVVLLFDPALQIGQLRAWVLLTGLLVIFIGVPIGLEKLLQKITIRHAKLQWLHTKLSEVLRVTVSNLHDVRFLGKVFGLGFLLFLRTILIFHLYFTVFQTPVSLPALAIFYTLFKLSFFIILTPGNLGVQELAWGFLSEQMNVGMGQGILISGFTRVVSSSVLIVLGTAFGGIDLIRRRRQYLDPPAMERPANQTEGID